MPQRIHEDHKMFRDVVGGKIRRELQKHVSTGHIFRLRGKKGKISIPVPRIGLPHFRYGKSDDGVGRGEGDKGKVVGTDPGKSKSKGKGKGKAGQDPSEGMMVDIDLEVIMKLFKEELELPNLKPKPSRVFEETLIKYNNIAKTGPQSLIHRRRTMTEALKRTCAMNEFDKLTKVPGFDKPMRIITPIKDDFRYRQWTEEKIPCSNAVIFFARDGSGSMTTEKTEIVSDIAWWVESYIRTFYKKVRREYVWHDTLAEIVDEKTFYGKRFGGGTICSTALKLIAEQFKHRYTTDKWNIYVFYFTDGDNWGDDNEKFCRVLKEEMNSDVVNLFGMAQILSWRYGNSLKEAVDNQIKSGELNADNYRTTEIAPSGSEEDRPWWGWNASMPEEERDLAIKNAIKDLLGKQKNKSVAA